jgi:hypothetical protein
LREGVYTGFGEIGYIILACMKIIYILWVPKTILARLMPQLQTVELVDTGDPAGGVFNYEVY